MKVIDLIPVIDKKCIVDLYIERKDYIIHTSIFEGLAKDIPERFLLYEVETINAEQKFTYEGISYRVLKINIKHT